MTVSPPTAFPPLRRRFAVLGVAGILAAGGLGFAWMQRRDRIEWESIRPVAPPVSGSAAPGLDARFSTSLARLQTWPVDLPALGEFARLCQANGLHTEALQAYRILMRFEPENARWCHYAATLLAGAGDLEAARPQWQKVLSLAPDYSPAYLRLGEALLKSNEAAAAGKVFASWHARQPRNARALFGLARCDLQLDRWTAARLHLQEALAAEPDFPAAQNLLATVLDRLGQTEAARAMHARIHRDSRFRDEPDPWIDELDAYCHQPYTLLLAASRRVSDDHYSDAVPLLERALSLDPNYAPGHRKLGTTLMVTGDTPRALSHLKTAAELAPANDGIQLDYLAALKLAKDSGLAAAITAAVAACPESAGVHYEAGRLALQQNRPADALEHFTTATRLQPDRPGAAVELALLHFQRGEDEAGIAVLTALPETALQNSPGLLLLARHAIEHGDPRAEAWARQAVQAGGPPGALADLRRRYESRFGASLP